MKWSSRTDDQICIFSKDFRKNAKKEEKIMFARLTTLQFKVEGIDEAIKIYKENIVPATKSQKGYQGLHFFLDPETGKGASITLWETEEDAIANENNRYYQEQIVKHMHLYAKPPIRERYEVVFKN